MTVIDSGGLHGPHLLPGLGTMFAYAPLTVVVCRACGLVRLFAQPDALDKLDKAKGWQRVPSAE